MPGQMALIGKSGCCGHLRYRLSRADHRLCLLQPPHQQEPMRACRKGGAEMPRQRKAIETGDAFQFLRAHTPRDMRLEIIPRSLHLPPGNGAQGPLRQTGMLDETIGEPRDEIVDEELIQLAIELAERRQQQAGETIVFHHGIIDERQADTRRLKALKHDRWLQIEHAIDKPVLRRRSAIMQLVRMQDDHPPRQAVALLAAIAECLNAAHGDAERVGIVPVQIEGIAPELRLDALDARIGRRRQNAVGIRRHAQTFKTLEDLSGYIVVQCPIPRLHESDHRCSIPKSRSFCEATFNPGKS